MVENAVPIQLDAEWCISSKLIKYLISDCLILYMMYSLQLCSLSSAFVLTVRFSSCSMRAFADLRYNYFIIGPKTSYFQIIQKVLPWLAATLRFCEDTSIEKSSDIVSDRNQDYCGSAIICLFAFEFIKRNSLARKGKIWVLLIGLSKKGSTYTTHLCSHV